MNGIILLAAPYATTTAHHPTLSPAIETTEGTPIMLILRRKEGQWLEIRHRSGDTIRVRVCNIRARYPGQLDLALDDPAHNFLIHRPERAVHPASTPSDATAPDPDSEPDPGFAAEAIAVPGANVLPTVDAC